MKASRFSEEQIINVIKEAAQGIPVPEICRKHGISSWTVCRRRKRYSGLEVSEAKRLRELEPEHARLKRLAAHYALDHQILKETLGKKQPVTRGRRALVRPAADRYGISARLAGGRGFGGTAGPIINGPLVRCRLEGLSLRRRKRKRRRAE